MRSWIFRNLRRLEAIYGAEGRPRPVTEPNALVAEGEGDAPSRLRLCEMRPHPPRRDLSDRSKRTRRA